MDVESAWAWQLDDCFQFRVECTCVYYAHVHQGTNVDLPVAEDAFRRWFVQPVHTRIRDISREACDQQLLLFIGKKSAGFGPVHDKPLGAQGNYGGKQAFDDEDPAKPKSASLADRYILVRPPEQVKP